MDTLSTSTPVFSCPHHIPLLSKLGSWLSPILTLSKKAEQILRTF